MDNRFPLCQIAIIAKKIQDGIVADHIENVRKRMKNHRAERQNTISTSSENQQKEREICVMNFMH